MLRFRNHKARNKIVNILSIVLTYLGLLSLNILAEPIFKTGFSEFAGGDHIPFEEISATSIENYCTFLNNTFGNVCDENFYTNIISDPFGLVIAPSGNMKRESFDMLLLVNQSGELICFDGNPEHQDSYLGLKVAHITGSSIETNANCRLGNIVSNYNGDFWIVDLATGQILRIKHRWDGHKHSFVSVGSFKINAGSILDLYYTDMNTVDVNDDRLYLLCKLPERIIVIDPFFAGDTKENSWISRDISNAVSGGIQDPQVIFGAYNNELNSNNDPRIIFVLDKTNRLTKFKDNGQITLVDNQVRVAVGNSSKFSCMRTNSDGELYILDGGENRLLKYSKELVHLWSIGKYGSNSKPWDIRFNKCRSIATVGKELFVSEDYTATSGVQRFQNVAKILEYNLNNLPYNGYNPQNCLQGIRPFPNVKFKLSEGCEVRYKIFERVYDDLDSNTSLSPLWADTVGTFESGWNEAPITWDGLNEDSDTVRGNVVFAITTHKYWDDGDDSELELFRLDYTPPSIVDSGGMQYNTYVSTQKPFYIDIPMNEISSGTLYIKNNAGTVIDSVEKNVSENDSAALKHRIRFQWNLAGLDSCDAFHAHAVFKDLAGNTSELIKIADIIGTSFQNASGGIIKKEFSIYPSAMSPISKNLTKRSVELGMSQLESYCDSSIGDGTPTDFTIDIYDNPGLTGIPVYHNSYLVTGPLLFDWRGTDNNGVHVSDGNYYVKMTAENHAGYSVGSTDSVGFNNMITIKTAIPELALNGISSNVIITNEGEQAFYIDKKNSVVAAISWPTFTPVDGSIAVELYSAEQESEIHYSDTLDAATANTIEFPFSPAMQIESGVYKFKAYYIDSLENSGEDNASAISIIHDPDSISKIFVDYSTPSLYIDLSENIIDTAVNVECHVFNNSYGISSSERYTYIVDVLIQYPDSSTQYIVENDSFPDTADNVVIIIPSSNFQSNGKYSVKAVLKNNFDKISDTAYSFIYLNERPLEIGINTAGDTLHNKIYITGSIGDPDITSTGEGKDFNQYIVLYKPGADQIPSSLDMQALKNSGWFSSPATDELNAIYAPFYRQHIQDSIFPYSNRSILPTNLYGYASIAYLNTHQLTDTTYTVIALTYEHGNSIPKWGTTNVIVNNTVERDTVSISDFQVTEMSQGIDFSCRVNKNAHIIAIVAQYENGSFSKKINEFHKSEGTVNGKKEFFWDFKDAIGNTVNDGNYRILLTAEDIEGSSFDYKMSDQIAINSNLVVRNAGISSQSITFPDDPDTPIPDNIATIQFTSNKNCTAQLEMYYQGVLYATVGPVTFNNSGADIPKVLNWNGAGNNNIPFSNGVNPYDVILTVKAFDDSIDSFDTTFALYRNSLAYEAPGIPAVNIDIEDPDTLYDNVVDNATEGTADVYWRTTLGGQRLSDDSLAVEGRMLVSGKQQVNVWKTDSDSNSYEIRVKKRIQQLDSINVKVKVDYVIRGDFDTTWFCQGGTRTRTYYDTYCISLSTNGDTVNTGEKKRDYCLLRQDGETCENCPYLREITQNPIVTIENVYSGNNENANDLRKFINWNYTSSRNNKPNLPQNKKAKYTLYFWLNPAYLHELEWDSVLTNPADLKPHHYNPLAIDTNFNDLDLSLYLAHPVIDYEYEFIKIPENGYIQLHQFDDYVVSPIVALNKLGYRKDLDSLRAFIFSGPLDNPTDTAFIRQAPPPEMINGQPMHLAATVYCEADTTMLLHWPFPADTVPSLITESGVPYDQIAYKTNDNQDPRRIDSLSLEGKFDQIYGMYRVADDSVLVSTAVPQIIEDFSLTVRTNDANPLLYPLTPNIFNPDDYMEGNTQRLIMDSLVATRDTSSGHNNLPSGVRVDYNEGTRILSISRDYQQLPRIPWTSSDDSLLSDELNGFLSYNTSFSKEGFQYVKDSIYLRMGYRYFTDIVPGTGSIDSIDTYPYSFWRQSSGVMTRNNLISYGNGLPLSEYSTDVVGFDHISLHYPDGSPNTDVAIMSIDSSGQDIIKLKHAPLPTPKRFIEIVGDVKIAGAIDTSYTIDYYEVSTGSWNPYGPIRKNPLYRLISHDENKLGYWDITHCNGSYVLKIAVQRGDSLEQKFQTVNIGKKIEENGANAQIVFSPYSKAHIGFKPNSAPDEIVTIIPIKPSEISQNISTGIVPIGPVLEILPSGLVFNEPRPTITFNFTYDDIIEMDIPLNQLGLLNIYYVDEQRGELIPLEVGVSKVLIREYDTLSLPSDSTHHTPMQPGQIAQIEGTLEHTSIYGFFNGAGNFTFNTVAEYTRKQFIETLSGTGPAGNAVYLYVSQDTSYIHSELVDSTLVLANGSWNIDSLELTYEGKNYLFAVTTIDGENRTLQTATVFDITPPDLSGNNSPLYISRNTPALNSFTVSANEDGKLVVDVLGNKNIAGQEIWFQKQNDTQYIASVPLLSNKGEDQCIYSLRAYDKAGNVSEPFHRTVIFDNTRPAISPIELIDTIAGSLRITALIEDNRSLSTVALNILNYNDIPLTNEIVHSVIGSDYDLSEVVSILPEELQLGLKINVEAIDIAGNRSVLQKLVGIESTIDVNDWKFSKLLPIRNLNLNSSIAHFPMLIRLNAANFNFEQAKEDGSDLRITTSENEMLHFEIEHWDAVNKDATLWVRIPHIERTDREKYLRLYWGNPDASKLNGYPVWFNEYNAVYHFNTEVYNGRSPEYIVYEGFDYPSGTEVHDNCISGFGWQGAWQNVRSPEYHKVIVTESDSNIGNIPGTGNAIEVENTTAHLYRNVAHRIGDVAGQDIWISYIMGDYDKGENGATQSLALIDKSLLFNNDSIHISNRLPAVTITGKDDERLFTLHKHYSDTSWIADSKGSYGNGAVPWTAGQHLVVIKIDVGSESSDMYAWIDPARLDTLNEPDLSFSGNNNGPVGFDGVRWHVEPYYQDRTASLDEIRIGNSLLSVTGNVPFETVSNNIFDATVWKNDGVSNQSHWNNASIIANGLQLNNVGSEVLIDSLSGNPVSSGFGVSTWLKASPFDSMSVIAQQRDGVSNWQISLSSNRTIVFLYNGTPYLQNDFVIDTNWTHIAITHNGVFSSLYINGNFIASDYFGWQVPSDTANVYLGAENNTNFRGTIDEFRIAAMPFTSDYIKLSYLSQIEKQTIVQNIPLAPSVLNIEIDEEAVMLSFDETHAVFDLIEIERRTQDVNEAWENVAVLSSGLLRFSDTGVTCGAAYEYRMRSKLQQSYSEWASIITVTTPECEYNREMFDIVDMALDYADEPINDDSAEIVIRFYNMPFDGIQLDSAEFVQSVKHGLCRLRIGKSEAIHDLLSSRSALYSEIEVNGYIQNPRIPISSRGIKSVTNSYRLSGSISPVGKIHGPVGAIYFDLKDKLLYVKYGNAVNDWHVINQ